MTEQNVIDALIGICGFAVVWWVKTIWSMVIHQQEQINALSIKLVEGYVPRLELEKSFARLFDTMDDIKSELSHINRNYVYAQQLRKTVDDLK